MPTKINLRSFLGFSALIGCQCSLWLVDATINLSLTTFVIVSLLLAAVAMALVLSINNNPIGMIFIGIFFLVIYGQPVASLLEPELFSISQTTLFKKIVISDSINKKIFFLTNIICFLIALLSSLSVKEMGHTRPSFNQREKIFFTSSLALSVFLMLVYCPLQVEYLTRLQAEGYAAVFDSSTVEKSFSLVYSSRVLFYLFSAIVLQTVIFKLKMSIFIKVIIFSFLLLELSSGQRGDVILFLLAWAVISQYDKEVLRKTWFADKFNLLIILGIFVAVDFIRSGYVGTSVIRALYWMGMPLNTYQFFVHHFELLASQDRYYSIFGVVEYFVRLSGTSLNYGERSLALLRETSYLGHIMTSKINLSAWLAGYGTGSPFLLELIGDFGFITGSFLFIMIVALGIHWVRINSLKPNIYRYFFIFILIQWLALLSRSPLSNIFPEIIFMLFLLLFHRGVVTLLLGASKLVK